MARSFTWLPGKRHLSPIGIRPTLGGIWFIFGISVIGLAAMDADVNLLLAIFGCCIGALIINILHGWRTLPMLTVRRIVPETAVAGQPFVIRYAVTNRSRLAVARNIHLTDVLPRRSPLSQPEVFIESLPPGETVTLSTTVAAVSRGRLTFNAMIVSSRFPMHLFVKWVRREMAQEVIVFPPLGQMTGEIKIAARATENAGLGGNYGWSQGDEEFYGVREYREGDNPRRIHWRRSARTGQLMIREMAQPRSFQLWCVVNSLTRPHDADQAMRLDCAISAAATFVCETLERGARIGLICNGDPFVVLPPGTGRAFRPRLLTELAIRGLNTEDELASQIHRLSWPARWHCPCFVFGANHDEDMRAAARALTRTIGPATIFVPGTPAFDNLFEWPYRPDYNALRSLNLQKSPAEVRKGVGRRVRRTPLEGVAR
ncbi:MAG: DUF58 domain-containing protein [Phycisphaerae bacterium]|nr:DUF58 domain-containing protein [Phycisphaerae bacterium]